jgi:MFS family permease
METSASTATPRLTTSRGPAPAHPAALVLLCAPGLPAGLDFVIMNVALPHPSRRGPLARRVGARVRLDLRGLLLLGGRLADVCAPRRLYVAGVLMFAVVALVGGIAPNGTVLILTRAGQGVGTAPLIASALALIAFSRGYRAAVLAGAGPSTLGSALAAGLAAAGRRPSGTTVATEVNP